MNMYFPDSGTVRTVLALASRAPSAYNTQPWRWRVGRASLHLFYDPRRHLPNTDPDGRDRILSCGAALNHCVIALAALGWRAKVSRLPDPADPRHLASLELVPYAADQLDILLAAAIPRRRTDRRHYSSWSVPVADIALMAARAARAGVTLCRVEATEELKTVVAQSVAGHATNHGYLAERAAWSGRYASPDGAPTQNALVPDPAAAVPGRQCAAPVLAMPSDTSPYDDSLMLALGTRTDDRLAQLRAGEAASIVLLTATAMGLASCPVTEPLEIGDTREAMRRNTFSDDGYPQMLIRVGWAPINADPLASTPRRPLVDIVEWPTDGR